MMDFECKIANLYLHFCMKQTVVDSKRLARRLEAAILRSGKSYKEIATRTGIDASRVSRFCNGEFKRVTPVLEKLCDKLNVSWKSCIAGSEAHIAQREVVESIHRLIGKAPEKATAVRRLVRCVELLFANNK